MAKKGNVTLNFDAELKLLGSAIKKDFLNKLARFTIKQIRDLTRAGFQLQDKGSRGKKHDPLTDFTKKKRRQLSNENATDSLYSPDRSNLTFTGELLKAITHDIKKKNTIKIFVNNKKHKVLRDSQSVGKKQKSLTNKQIQADLNERDREFLAIDNELEKQIVNKVRRFINKELRKIRKG